MSVKGGPNTVTSGLVLELDAGNIKSYPTTGTTWFDKSGNANNGTLTNGPTFNTGSLGSIVFDGVDDYCSGSILVPSSFTANFWFKPLQLRNYNPGFVINDWGDFIWHTTSDGSIYCGTDLGNRFNPNSPGCGPGSIIVNTIYNYTYTYNLGVGSLYKNGILTTTSNSHTIPVSAGTVKPYFVASSPGSFGISNVISYIFQIYNRALSATEVLQNYNAIKTRFGIQ
jgi:hypothetical protein